MQAAQRLGLAFLLLIAAFLVLVAFAAASLLAAREPMLAAVVATAGVAGVAVGAVTWCFARTGMGDEAMEEQVEAAPARPAPSLRVTAPARRQALRVQSLPVADLPPAYVTAVLEGAHARLAALKSQSHEHG